MREEGEGEARSLILSGSYWIDKFPASRDTNDLEDTFKTNVQNFIKALGEAGLQAADNLEGVEQGIKIISTKRPPERCYLMHYSWKIAKDNYDPQKVPSKSGVSVNWWHDDLEKSRNAAQLMVDGYKTNELQIAPALKSKHSDGKAIDMALKWKDSLKIKKIDGSEVTIESGEKDHTNPELIEVAKSYDVIHFIDVNKDKTHWSDDGK
ncbi:MAG: hypothetical protein A2169_12660 [Deltaproteobacteria bacterium RBG_13_47_9]|nr:MAG: hypothetical protein A2169_12660 [Deltaproteobacteria bacterium RBG_13_47_9]